ncbi:MAG: helix-turn-helix transcriptional regulator, partial [Myxococcales bacterium]|nr:helix-turn-helix transcriptional regulator [Myxococcales bacterium]
CFSTVRGRDAEGRMVCRADCPRRLHCGEPRVDEVHHVRDRPSRLICAKVGEVVTVFVREVFQPPLQDLSDRELEVLQLVASGRTDGEVGVQLGISIATARTHMENVRRKLGARSRAEAVARALTLGRIRLPAEP